MAETDSSSQPSVQRKSINCRDRIDYWTFLSGSISKDIKGGRKERHESAIREDRAKETWEVI